MAAASTGKGERIYAIGDVHGRYDLLCHMMKHIEEHCVALPEEAVTHLVLLGDLIDRGPDSADVLGMVHEAWQRSDKVIVVLGNHEELMLRALDGEAGMLRAWMRVGGVETVRSFGLEPPARDASEAAYIREAKAVIPNDVREWLRALPLSARSGDYLFCHAGIRPGVALKRQARTDLLWIRDEFLTDDRDHGAVVVHGHSIAEEVEMRGNRIGIDTGAYRTGVLSALFLEGTARHILSVDEKGDLKIRDAAELAA